MTRTPSSAIAARTAPRKSSIIGRVSALCLWPRSSAIVQTWPSVVVRSSAPMGPGSTVSEAILQRADGCKDGDRIVRADVGDALAHRRHQLRALHAQEGIG